MNKFYSYINSAIYNIRHNKAYAAFCVLGTALTFIFISIVLQMTNEIVNNVPPFVNADRQIQIKGYRPYMTKGGDSDNTGFRLNEIPLFLKDIDNYELCALRYMNQGSVLVNNRFRYRTMTVFVNGDYWQLNKFNFIKGRSFTEEEAISKAAVAVISKSFAKANFKTDEVLGEKLAFDNTTYTIIGVVDEYANLINDPINIWIPYKSMHLYQLYSLDILPKAEVKMDEFKNEVLQALKFHYEKKSIDVDLNSINISTLKENRTADIGGGLLSYGIPIILFILLLIPAINIVAISVVNINNRATEIAIRRSMGATIFSSFILIIIENLLLVSIGVIVGVSLSFPAGDLLDNLFANSNAFGKTSLISKDNIWMPILYTIPLALLFTLLSGGIPAYFIAKGKIAKVLKDDFSKNMSSNRRVSGIMLEQILIFIILMISIVSISTTVSRYNKPGLIGVENVVTFTPIGGKNDAEVSSNMNLLVENFKKNPNVKAFSIGDGFAPYHSYPKSDSIIIDRIKIEAFIKFTDENAINVFGLELIEGGWLTKETLSDGHLQAVITQDLADKLNWSESVGRKISLDGLDYIIVGVLDGFRQSAFRKQRLPCIILPNVSSQVKAVSVKVKDVDAFNVDFYAQWNKLMKDKNVRFHFGDLEREKQNDMLGEILGLAVLVIPTIFLLIFAFIGTFGIFWLSSQKRIKEFALRIAIGSTPTKLIGLVIKESIVITSISIVPGLLLSFFIYEFTIVHIIAIGITVILMLLFSIFSAWYPAYTVSKINPAKAIKYE